MPTCKIFLSKEEKVSINDLERFNKIIIDGLETVGEHAVVAAIPDALVNLSGCYIELTCRHKPERTPEMLNTLARRLEQEARTAFEISDPIRVRIIMVEESLLAAVN